MQSFLQSFSFFYCHLRRFKFFSLSPHSSRQNLFIFYSKKNYFSKFSTMLQQDENRPKLFFMKTTENACVPTRGSKLAAGYDLKSAYNSVVPKRGSTLVKTDIRIHLPPGTYGRIAPRSGLALKNKIDVGAGVIDEDYRGDVGVILFNHGDEDFKIEKGDRIAQLICEKIYYPEMVELKSLDESERGEGGFGSTGLKSPTKEKTLSEKN